MSDKIKIELTRYEAESLARAAESQLQQHNAAVIRTALAEHAVEDWRRRMGLPWRVDNVHGCNVLLANGCWRATDPTTRTMTEFDRFCAARLMASAPRLAQALAGLLDAWCDPDDGPRGRAAEDEARAALVESGWPTTEGGE